jgi:hypothetical protein
MFPFSKSPARPQPKKNVAFLSGLNETESKYGVRLVSDSNLYPSGQIDLAVSTTKGRSPHWRWLGWLGVAALLSGYVISYLKLAEDLSHLVDRLVVSLGFFILLFGLIFRELSRIRKEKFANIMNDLHSISHIVRDQHTILDAMAQQNVEEFTLHAYLIKQNTQQCLNHFASIFSILTGTKCRAAIKLIEPGNDPLRPVVYTFKRDSDSMRFSKADDEDRRTKGVDFLDANTDFKSVFGKTGSRWFFSNDLTTRSNYLNSRDEKLSGRHLTFFESLLNWSKPQQWALPYSSGIVWPIRQRPIDGLSQAETSFVGFLTIDGSHRRVFDERFDVYIGASVADSFYSMLIRLDEVQPNKQTGQA